jgi:hypothetical protein
VSAPSPGDVTAMGPAAEVLVIGLAVDENFVAVAFGRRQRRVLVVAAVALALAHFVFGAHPRVHNRIARRDPHICHCVLATAAAVRQTGLAIH